MRLWHQDLLSEMCQQHILGQHRECCALRGDGWNKDHETVQYALNAAKSKMVAYHWLVMENGYTFHEIDFDMKWWNERYQGSNLPLSDKLTLMDVTEHYWGQEYGDITIYHEHDRQFLRNDIEDLQARSADPDHGCDCDVSLNLLEEAV